MEEECARLQEELKELTEKRQAQLEEMGKDPDQLDEAVRCTALCKFSLI